MECQHHLVTPSHMTPQKQGHASRGHDPLGRLPSWTRGAVSQSEKGRNWGLGPPVALLTPANPGHQSCAQKIVRRPLQGLGESLKPQGPGQGSCSPGPKGGPGWPLPLERPSLLASGEEGGARGAGPAGGQGRAGGRKEGSCPTLTRTPVGPSWATYSPRNSTYCRIGCSGTGRDLQGDLLCARHAVHPPSRYYPIQELRPHLPLTCPDGHRAGALRGPGISLHTWVRKNCGFPEDSSGGGAGSVSGLSASGLCRTGIPTYSRGKRHGARADPLDLSLARGLENQHRKAGTLGVRLLGQVWGWAGGTGRGSATAARRGSEREPPFLVLCLQKGKGEAECPAGTAGPHPPEEDEVQIGAPGAAKVTASQHRKRLSC